MVVLRKPHVALLSRASIPHLTTLHRVQKKKKVTTKKTHKKVSEHEEE